MYGGKRVSKAYCPICGLQYTKSQIKMRAGICQECEPEKFKEQYEKDIVYMQTRNMGQEHITEHTFFPKKAPSRQYQEFKWYRRQQK